jgi:hypothetical protein
MLYAQTSHMNETADKVFTMPADRGAAVDPFWLSALNNEIIRCPGLTSMDADDAQPKKIT